MRVEWASGLDGPGPASANADRVAAVELAAVGAWAFLVADGAGGSGDGARAATTVLERFGTFVRLIEPAHPALVEAEAWVDFLADLDAELSRADAFGESTAVALVVTADQILGASVGDSGALFHQPEAPEPWHYLTAGQQRKPLLGSGAAWPVGFRESHQGGTLLLSSDGLFPYAPREALHRLITQAGPLADLPGALIDLVRLRSGQLPDDVGLIVARIDLDRFGGAGHHHRGGLINIDRR